MEERSHDAHRLRSWGAFSPLREPAFVLVWTAQAIVAVGNSVRFVALIFGLLSRGSGPLLLSMALVVVATSSLVTSNLFESVTRNHNEKWLVVSAYLAIAAACVGTAVFITYDGTTIVLFLFLTLLGVSGGLLRIAARTYFSSVIWRAKDREAAEELLRLNPQLGLLIGAPAGGILVGAVGPGFTFLAVAIAFLVIAAVAIAAPKGPGRSGHIVPLWREWIEGGRVLLYGGVVATVLLVDVLADVATAGQLSVGLALVASEARGPSSLGLLLSAVGAGSLVGIAISRVSPPLRTRRGMTISLLHLAQAPLLAAVPFVDIPKAAALLVLISALR